ncbi:hypothetical protein NC651_027596 [Populus alba x Populus x berolinensis]|nr:hypothetical protein NC651_027596 [Populus alba x Populus x berolinensis]
MSMGFVRRRNSPTQTSNWHDKIMNLTLREKNLMFTARGKGLELFPTTETKIVNFKFDDSTKGFGHPSSSLNLYILPALCWSAIIITPFIPSIPVSLLSSVNMGLQNEEKLELGCSGLQQKPRKWILLMVRVVAFLATAAATLVMALNKETKTLVVATVGNTPIKVTLTAKFQHTPAFVFFVVANGMASFHNLVMIMVELCGQKLDYKGLRLAMVAILDMMTVALVSGGAGAATFMAELGKKGNSHARWDKICDKFETFCDHGGAALIASSAGLILMMIISVMSIMKLLIKPKSDSS